MQVVLTQLDSQGARVKELEMLLRQERSARESAEDDRTDTKEIQRDTWVWQTALR